MYKIGEKTKYGCVVGYEFYHSSLDKIIEARSQEKANELIEMYPSFWRYIIKEEKELYIFQHELK